MSGNINRELESLDLNLPPGTLNKAVKKAGLTSQVNEQEILKTINIQIIQNKQTFSPLFKQNSA